MAFQEERNPSLRDMLMEAPISASTVRFTLTDIFDQTAPAVIVSPAMVKVSAPLPVTSPTVAGLSYELRHQDSKRRVNHFNPPLQKPDEEHHWLTLDEIPQGHVVRRGVSRGFDLGVRENRDHGYSLTFRGLLRVPTSGAYVFRAQIDGAYRFQLDGSDVLV
jgi:hypothetical protein